MFWAEKMVRNCISGCSLGCVIDSLPLPLKSPSPSRLQPWLPPACVTNPLAQEFQCVFWWRNRHNKPFQSPKHLLSWDAGNAHLALQPENSMSHPSFFSSMKYLRYIHKCYNTLQGTWPYISYIAIHRPLRSTCENKEWSHLGNLLGKGPCEFQRLSEYPEPSNHSAGRGILSTPLQKKCTFPCSRGWSSTPY